MKKNGKASEPKKIDRERETRVLLEDMHSDIKRIAEAQIFSNDRFGRLEIAVAELIPLKSEVKALSSAVMQLSGDLKEVKNDVKDLKNKVDENLSNHEKRITKIEEKVLV